MLLYSSSKSKESITLGDLHTEQIVKVLHNVLDALLALLIMEKILLMYRVFLWFFLRTLEATADIAIAATS